MSKTIKRLLVVLVGVLFATSVYAQSTTASIAGHVTDENGPLTDAMITAVYTPSGIAYHAFSNRDGSFRINGVVAGGPYTVKVEHMAHRPLVLNNVQAPLSGTVVLNLVMKADAVTLEEVVVTAEMNSNMDIQNSGAGTFISNQTIENVPTTNRSMNDILKLTPQGSVAAGGFSVGGGNYRGSSVTVDGASFNNAFGIGSNLPAGGSPLSLDAIDQISINLTPFDVRQSGFQGGAINVVTKHGGNQWHASVYDYYTSNALHGVKIDDDKLPNVKTLNNVMGMTLSGPIIKDKLFFFVNAEYTMDEEAGSTATAQETADPNWEPGSSVHRPTVEQMETIRTFLKDNYNGYDPGRYQGYSLKTPDYKLLARLDWNINKDNLFNIRFSHTHTYTSNIPSSSMDPIGKKDTKFIIGGVEYSVNRNDEGRQSYYTMYFESARYYQEQNFTSLAAELNSRLFKGKGTNTLRATWSLQNEPRSHYGELFPTVDILEPYVKSNGDTGYAFYTTFGIDPFTYMNTRRVNTVNVTDELTYTVGIHNIIGGVQFEFNRIINGFMRGGAGWYIFDSWETFANGGNPLSMMITHANLDDPKATVYPTFDQNQLSLYAQDEMEFSKYFKFTAGLRLELPFVTFPNNNLNKDFADIAAKNPESSFAGLSTDDFPAVSLNVSPRVGFNWDVLKDRSLVVRGGTGLFTGRIPNVWIVSAAGNSNVLQYSYIANYYTGNQVYPFCADREDIINAIYAGSAYHQQDLPAPTGATILAKDLRMPTSWKSSLAVDAKLPFGIKGTLEGIYSYNYNEVIATTLGYRLGDSIQLPGEPEKRAGYVSENIMSKSGEVMNGYYLHNAKDLHGRYYSITAQLEKNFAFGLDLMAAYTHSFSMSVTDGSGEQIYNLASINNVNDNNGHELGYSAFVTPNRIIASAAYTINEGVYTATKLGLFYEGYNIGRVGNYTQTGMSYLIKNVSGMGGTQLIYIPTKDELKDMPFSSDENRDAYETFISNDRYLNAHRGEYSMRNCVTAPWVNRINLKVDQLFYFNVGGQQTVLEVGADLNNVGNLFNSEWGTYKQISSETILEYKNGQYTFTEPKWNSYKDFVSTWQLLLHVRYSF